MGTHFVSWQWVGRGERDSRGVERAFRMRHCSIMFSRASPRSDRISSCERKGATKEMQGKSAVKDGPRGSREGICSAMGETG